MCSIHANLGAAENNEARRENLQLLLDRLLPSRIPTEGRVSAQENSWEAWVERTGELPPDFDAMPSIPHLPDPLMSYEGEEPTPITTPEQWERQRKWIRSQIEQWVFGTMPPAPDNLRVAESREFREGRVTIREVLLEFGPDHQAKLNLQLMIPDGEGPFPVFLTNHSRNRPWVNTAVNRGYIACFYQATDPIYGDPDDSDAYIEIYPDYDFSNLARWAWAASRAVDYLVTLPEVAADQIGLTAHSRGGKQALLAAAFDERIGAVIPSSGLTGEVHPWRYTTDPFVVESIQLLTGARPQWFHPRLRFFTGREHKLPVDQNMLMSLIAPRGLMMYSAYSESSASAFAIEQAYRSVMEVYRFHDREENVWLHLREGEHAVEVADIENFIDFFDTIFGRKNFPKQETWIYGYDFSEWKELSGATLDPKDYPVKKPGEFAEGMASDWEGTKARLREQLLSVLGEASPSLEVPLARSLFEARPAPRNPLELVFGRPEANDVWRERLARSGMGFRNFPYGPGQRADFFYPVNEDGSPRGEKWPVVIWLHPYAHAVGWSAKDPWNPRRPNFVRDQRPQIDSLVRRGFAVVAFDQIGFGSRTHEMRTFYQRYPQWSLMGKMVDDTQAVVRAVAAFEEVDASQIHLLGYSLGAKVGLLTAALEDQVAGLAAVSGLFPFRLDDAAKGTEGIRHYSHLHGLIPQLGFFLGHENRVPFDYDEALALAAPKQVLIVAPELDRYAPVEDVGRYVDEARQVYRHLGQEENLELWTPRDFNRFPRHLQEEVFSYLEKIARER